MKIKVFLLLICLTLLSACNMDYSLEIKKDNSSEETIIIHDYSNYYNKNDVKEIIFSEFSDLSNITYDVNDSYITINRKMLKYHDLNDDYIIDDHFGTIKADSGRIIFTPDYEKCIFLFSDGGEYISDDKIEVNIKIPFKIKNNNADKVTDNIYTWNYSINDCNKEINVELYETNIIPYIIILVVVILLVIGIIMFAKKIKNKKY